MRPQEHGVVCLKSPVGSQGHTETHGAGFSDSLAVSHLSRTVSDGRER